MKILSWNVNGLRAVYKKGFLDILKTQNPDIMCVQETKAQDDQLPDDLKKVDGYTFFHSSAEKKGYSGTAVWTKIKPEAVSTTLNIKKFDTEGRHIRLDFKDFTLFNIYFPNGKASPERLRFKLDYYKTFLNLACSLVKSGKKIAVCGDVNTAHKEIDLARPKENATVSGFLPEERAWIDKFVSRGFVDTFRVFSHDGGHYSWWDLKSGARERNVGWRIDYFFISENLKPKLQSAFILSHITGSDHCPVGIELS